MLLQGSEFPDDASCKGKGEDKSHVGCAEDLTASDFARLHSRLFIKVRVRVRQG